MNSDKIINKWLKEGYIIKCNSLAKRKKDEMKSLVDLKKRSGFLVDYNIAIRYMHLYFLGYGCDLNICSVHLALRKFLSELKYLSSEEIHDIILYRHKLKYDNFEVPLPVKENLIRTLVKLSLNLDRLEAA